MAGKVPDLKRKDMSPDEISFQRDSRTGSGGRTAEHHIRVRGNSESAVK